MKVTVIYYSKTENTKKVAESIYRNIDVSKKEIIDLNKTDELNDSDMYIVCFPIMNQNINFKVIECLEKIENAKILFVVTCGLNPSEYIKGKIEDIISIWLNESNEYLGMKLIQCKTSDSQKEVFYNQNTKYIEQLKEMFKRSDDYPSDDDFNEVILFVKDIIKNFE